MGWTMLKSQLFRYSCKHNFLEGPQHLSYLTRKLYVLKNIILNLVYFKEYKQLSCHFKLDILFFFCHFKLNILFLSCHSELDIFYHVISSGVYPPKNLN